MFKSRTFRVVIVVRTADGSEGQGQCPERWGTRSWGRVASRRKQLGNVLSLEAGNTKLTEN